MSKIKYTEEIIGKAIELRLAGKSIPEIVEVTGIKKPSLQKIFQEKGVKLNPEQKKEALARRWLNYEPVKDGQKQCSKCGDWRPIADFHTANNRLTGLVSACKDCYGLYYEEKGEEIRNRVNAYRIANPEKKKEADKNHYENNKDTCVAKAVKWNAENPEKRKEIKNSYDRRNQREKNARTARYRATKIQATPKWLSEQQIEEIKRIYVNCPKGFDVDHIVPLRGKGVRGLHVPWNLQYLLHLDNMKKGIKM